MARPRKSAGELGAVQVTKLASGKYRARARARDDAGSCISSKPRVTANAMPATGWNARSRSFPRAGRAY